MTDAFINALIHPIQSKLLVEIHTRGQATAKELASGCNGIAQATLYRHLQRLCQNGILQVVQENHVRGVVEKVYALDPALLAAPTPLTGEAYLQLFTQFMAGLLKEFQAYAGRPGIDVLKDGSGFSVGPVHATKAEMEAALTEIAAVIQRLRENPLTEERKHQSIAIIITPPKSVEEP